ncbi:MAG: ATP-binding protein [Gammaproteobacteria bacterium]|nr:ATP-binding protein [Gammaproteobacteria bacterium]
MIVKKLSEQDLNNFIKNQVPESRYLEYKSQILLDGNEKYEFCRDVSAFANTEGGHIIYGIKEENGLPVDRCKITDNIDELQIRISQILQSNLEPKLLGYYSYPLSGCLVISIRKSWNAPHAVKLDGSECKYQFAYRTDAGRQYYDIHTLKDKIMQYGTLIKDINAFIEARINNFCNENLNAFTNDGKIFVLAHMIPIGSYYNHNSIDVDSLNTDKKNNVYNILRPFNLGNDVHNFHIFPNLEGLRIYWNAPERHFYNQVFRNASIEACYEVNISSDPLQTIISFPAGNFETKLIDGINRLIAFLKSEGICEPCIVSINMFNINNCHLGGIGFDEDSMPDPVTKKRLNLGNIEIKLDEKIDDSLEPIFKILYNSFGLTKHK